MSILKKDNDIELFAENTEKPARKLRINIQNRGVNGINVSLPLEFVKRMAKMGNGISGVVGGGSLDSVKLDKVIAIAEEGVTGEIVNIVSDDGATISISVE